MRELLLVGLGGAFGSGARYGMSLWLRHVLGASFPFGTLAVNLVGSFLLGVVMNVSWRDAEGTSSMRLLLGTGVMGGFTTYSTFSYETVRAFEEGDRMLGASYVLVTLVGCGALGSLLGILAGRRLASGA